MGYNIRYSSTADKNLPYFTELILSLVRMDALDGKPAFGVVNKTEVLVCFLYGDNIHESRRVLLVSAHSSVNFNQTLSQYLCAFCIRERILKTISQEYAEW